MFQVSGEGEKKEGEEGGEEEGKTLGEMLGGEMGKSMDDLGRDTNVHDIRYYLIYY